MLRLLELENVGPAKNMTVTLDSRMNMFTGDNGLGKSFLLECCWWALTAQWTNKPIRPRSDSQLDSVIRYELGEQHHWGIGENRFDKELQKWMNPTGKRTKDDSLVIYSQVDGGFSIAFPHEKARKRQIVKLSKEQVWDGNLRTGKATCEGLIRDVVGWQQRKQEEFEVLTKVATDLSPRDETLKFSDPERIYQEDSRHFPMLRMPYGDVPVTEASAGMRRILALAYMMAWALLENRERARLSKSSSRFDGLILIVDEIEAHLHPEWQRTIVPSVIKVAQELSKSSLNANSPNFQFIASTHSPLVLASLETVFDDDIDQLFVFELEDREAVVTALDWAPYGTAAGWLTSPVFGLGEARSKDAEVAIKAAITFMTGDKDDLPVGLQSKDEIQKELVKCIPGQDPFWARWIVKTDKVN